MMPPIVPVRALVDSMEPSPKRLPEQEISSLLDTSQVKNVKRRILLHPLQSEKFRIVNYKIPAVSYMPLEILCIEKMSVFFRDVC